MDPPGKALAKAWEETPKGDAPWVKSDVRQLSRRRVCFTMTQEAFYNTAKKTYISQAKEKMKNEQR